MNEWDYTKQAKYYSLRPNYADEAINQLVLFVGAKKDDKYIIADVGAGTANLTIMFLERGFNCIAIEPNEAMQNIGMARTKNKNVKWITGTGENTSLPNSSIDLFAMGSSFNTTNRYLTLREAHRVLKEKGFFTCMWNHRDLDNDPDQRAVEEIIKRIIPEYEQGIRRNGQADFILSSGLFNNVNYIEESQIVERTVEEYIDAWKSVKNKYWDFETKEGQQTFNKITDEIRLKFNKKEKLSTIYKTKIWTAQRK